MRKRDKRIKSLNDLITKLKGDISDYEGPVWFRGQSNYEWKLQSSFNRQTNGVTETSLIKKFKQNATILINPRPTDCFDWLFIMQHHGVPTRLLDWSESPLTATFFAVSENQHLDGALWMLLPIELNRHSSIEPEYPYDIPSFEDVLLKNYTPESIASETTSRLNPIAAIAPRNSLRMHSQLGVFTVQHRLQLPIEEIGDRRHVLKHIP